MSPSTLFATVVLRLHTSHVDFVFEHLTDIIFVPGPDNTRLALVILNFNPQLSRYPRLLDPILPQGIGLYQCEDYNR